MHSTEFYIWFVLEQISGAPALLISRLGKQVTNDFCFVDVMVKNKIQLDEVFALL